MTFETESIRALQPVGLFSLEGKVAVVTGAAGGIGRWLAAGLGAAGARVAVAAAAADELETFSPTALTVTLESVRRARTLPTLEAALEQEFGLVSWFIEQHDLREGIRAQVIDKDRSPKWSPDTLESVDPGLAARVIEEQVHEPVWAA